MLKNTYKKKMKALLEGLECENTDLFMEKGKIGDYRRLGIAYVKAVQDKLKIRD